MSHPFPTLFSPLTIRNVTVKNRIFSSAHGTMIATGFVNDELIAYHEARARGGAGLIIVEVASVHPTAFYSEHILKAETDECIPHYRRLAERIHAHDCRLFGQLFHPGREVLHSRDGSATEAYAPSAIPNDRFHVMPRAMPTALVREIIEGYGDAALRLKKGGLEGVEIVASQGYLPSQFLNPKVNVRTDEYGGSFENRLRFVREIIENIRSKVGDFVIGMRISGNEKDTTGLDDTQAANICEALDGPDSVDYFSVCGGTSATLGGSVHIAPPMFFDPGYVEPYAANVKSRVSKPIFVAGRFNQPQIAEKMLRAGSADMCAMTRALICDPQMPAKSESGRLDDIRACIGCNQACIGHILLGYPVSCIQHPETGRELEYGTKTAAVEPRKILIAGGGPAGMKAAAVASERGHQVTLYEQTSQLGGQTLLAQLLPRRAEFGGIATNLTREVELAGVEVIKSTEVTRELVEREKPDAVVLATGAIPYRPPIEGAEDAHVVDAWQVINGEANVGSSVVIADWRCDWVGMGLAEKLARDGCRVRLCVNGNFAGQMIQQYVRDTWLGALHELGIEVIPMARLFGVDADTAYFEHASSDQPIVCEDMDTMVLALGHSPEDGLETELADYEGELVTIGDCFSPRTAEEAVLDGLKVGARL